MSGGSMSNMYGMVLARFNKCPDVKTKGIGSLGQLVAFTSQEVYLQSMNWIIHKVGDIKMSILLLQGHYSITKAAHWTGLGTDNLIIVRFIVIYLLLFTDNFQLIKVPSDCTGRMIPYELENEILKALADKKIPFFVNATSGTTVLGAYDPLIPLADICKKYDVWLHVDVRWIKSLCKSKV